MDDLQKRVLLTKNIYLLVMSIIAIISYRNTRMSKNDAEVAILCQVVCCVVSAILDLKETTQSQQTTRALTERERALTQSLENIHVSRDLLKYNHIGHSRTFQCI
ncbi:hypothetical protein JTE90_008493 [Oedothorax gibbosus]|uniref:Uncharacterized protein n=1 Tax=Oedothorax gibbosus TaxID=931172 RepID=A0AAV6V0D2_9ARAC|nr:hypothetical protein JTE90_008493 [Oedothorax gibbosus]